ncbi:MAG: hypothetical protein JSS78_09985 [Bacteroidetes bacterium]|nr:hypothetical protein [Bacteroidota bacterium]
MGLPAFGVSGYPLQVRHKANAQTFSGLSAAIPKPINTAHAQKTRL